MISNSNSSAEQGGVKKPDTDRVSNVIGEGAQGLNGAPKGMRIQIAFFGKRNAGKSSLINALTRQKTALVSDVPGTTTDPVEKAMEMLPLGPVLMVDTAGIDDMGELGQARVGRTRKVMESTDIGVVAVEPGSWDEFEEAVVAELEKHSTPYVIAVTKSDLARRDAVCTASTTDGNADSTYPAGACAVVEVSSMDMTGIQELKDAIVAAAPAELVEEPQILRDLIPEHGLAVLVIPVDKEAPKGRIILPQMQTLRDLLDGHCSALVVQDTELERALGMLARKPDIVVTDSQAFAQVSPVVPRDVPLTGFSVLFARFKGDLPTLVRGAGTLETLRPGDRVLIAESCTHHPICDDIGTVKIPRILKNKVCDGLQIDHCQGTIFPDDLHGYKLVIHCGGCMLNRAGMASRLAACAEAGVPVTNYGMTIAHALGILDRALEPFDGAIEIYREARQAG